MDDLKQELVLDEHMITIEELQQRLGTSVTAVGVLQSLTVLTFFQYLSNLIEFLQKKNNNRKCACFIRLADRTVE